MAAPGKTVAFDASRKQVRDLFATFFSEQDNAHEGGFTLLVPFTVKGDMSAVQQFYFVFTNSAGAAEEAGHNDFVSTPPCFVQF